jgi:hypothetical protein
MVNEIWRELKTSLDKSKIMKEKNKHDKIRKECIILKLDYFMIV